MANKLAGNMLSSNWSIETYLRLKPAVGLLSVDYETQVVSAPDDTTRSVVIFEIPNDADPGLVHNNGLSGKLRYEFDDIFDVESSQEHVFDKVARTKVVEALDGVNCTIFAYGQTGSGKSYSIFGGDRFVDRGLIPRSISLVFEEIRTRKHHQRSFAFKCQISFTEVYKESVYDLLDQENRSHMDITQWKTVQIMEGENGIVIRNLNVFEVASEEEALQLFFMGNANRITECTAMNSMSSRSHAIFTLILESEGIKDDKTVFCAGKINLVDLAGSERMYKMANSKGLVKEAKAINLSLHYLEQVIVSLRDHAQSATNTSQKHGTTVAHNHYVPYRNSVLTSMLRDSLGGNCRSCFLITASIDKMHFEETVASCRFGQRCGEVKVKVVANTEIGLSDQLRELIVRVKALERQLVSSEEQRRHLEQQLANERALRKQQSELRVLNPQEKMACKNCVQQLLATAKDSLALSDSRSDNDPRLDAERVIELSQEALYGVVESMDKAVLIELSTALGGLVQSMFMERETARLDLAAKDSQQKERDSILIRQQELDALHCSVLKSKSPRELAVLPCLPESRAVIVKKGAVFVKHGWLGKKSVRHVSINPEELSMILLSVGGPAGKKQDRTALSLTSFESVDIAYNLSSMSILNQLSKVQQHESCTLVLRPKPAAAIKTLTLEYAEHQDIADNITSAVQWLEALRYLILIGRV